LLPFRRPEALTVKPHPTRSWILAAFLIAAAGAWLVRPSAPRAPSSEGPGDASRAAETELGQELNGSVLKPETLALLTEIEPRELVRVAGRCSAVDPLFISGNGRATAAELHAAALTVYGEHGEEGPAAAAERCAIAQVLFNRRDGGHWNASTITQVARQRGQFAGYTAAKRFASRLVCPRLQRSIEAVMRVANGAACPSRVDGYEFFCAATYFRRKHPGGKRGALKINQTVFLRDEPC
jgi:hypothetical protein